MQHKLSKILFFGEIKKLNIQDNLKQVKGEVKWQISNQFEQISISHTYSLKKTLMKPTKRAFF